MKIAIIGGGACGLFLASLLEQVKIEYCIFNEGKLGNKILASGNGKCNIGNINYTDEQYHNGFFANEIVSKHQKEFFELLKEYKIYTKTDEEGRMYPVSESSLSVLNAITRKITQPIVEIKVEHIHKEKTGYYINTVYGPFDKVVISCGSIAGYKNKTNFFSFLEEFDLNIRPFVPSLVGFKTSENLHLISGVRAKCEVRLYQKDTLIHQETGEVIFKENGISGICVMNLSGYYQRLTTKKDCKIVLDLSPNGDYDDYLTILHPKLLQYVNHHKINPHSFVLPVTGVYDFEVAQVCSGGIDLSEVNLNLTLKKDQNIFVGGEVLDVDGLCGGYNLMFAFCCGIVIYKEIAHEISD